MLTGLVKEEDQTEFGKNTVNAMSIDTLTWHFTLLMVAVGAAYLINNELKILIPSVSFPVYGIALICSVVLQGILKLLKLDGYVDKKIITHIGSSATDYLVAFGVASINIIEIFSTNSCNGCSRIFICVYMVLGYISKIF